MEDMKLSDEYKAGLIGRISDLCGRNILNKLDFIKIMEVCKSACQRRIDEIDKKIGTSGKKQ